MAPEAKIAEVTSENQDLDGQEAKITKITSENQNFDGRGERN